MIKVAVYCRVSTEKEDQANSFEAQQRYFKEYIDRKPEWEHYRTYADEGITGTSTKNRAQFNRMIEDAREGLFELIVTKEVSRFSRNILDTISYTRELRALGVGVIFMSDGISTLEPDAELRLSIMGSIAQEESRKTSARVKWGQTRQMERGVVFGRSLLGYDVKDGKISIDPDEAELVRLIFYKYGVEKKSASAISRELEKSGFRTRAGNTHWTRAYIIKLLKNEKYAGDLVQKKTITPDYLSHEKKYNHGEEPLVVINNHHEPIIDRELWNEVQKELEKRNLRGKYSSGHSNRYAFSGKIICGECGASFVPRCKKGAVRRWYCSAAVKSGVKGCGIGRGIRDDKAMEIMKKAIASLELNYDELIRELTILASEAVNSGKDSADKLRLEIERLNRKKEAVLDSFFSGTITEEEMRLMKGRYDGEIKALREKLGSISESCGENLREKVTEIVNGDTDRESFYRALLERMTVCKDGRIEVKLKSLPEPIAFSPF